MGITLLILWIIAVSCFLITIVRFAMAGPGKTKIVTPFGVFTVLFMVGVIIATVLCGIYVVAK